MSAPKDNQYLSIEEIENLTMNEALELKFEDFDHRQNFSCEQWIDFMNGYYEGLLEIRHNDTFKGNIERFDGWCEASPQWLINLTTLPLTTLP